ncbi:MAG: TIR domain-containing protein [Leptolyngbya sp. SIO1D8]|nr:TIR domain-containing protein [Leptolyngbya sp. SIO1D8]
MARDELLRLIDQAAKEDWIELDLAGQNLTELPPEIGQLIHLQQLDLRFNQLEDPPPEIIGLGINSTLNYLRQQLEQGKDYLYEAKFLIVGEGGAGKTSLAKKLLNPDCELDIWEASTEGIDVLRWDFPLRDGTLFRANIWDFGGQEIYHATHQFFLTKRSLYALVVDTRQDNTDLYYWLSMVSLLSDSSPVFIIKNEKQDRQCEVNERQLRGEFENLKETLPTNLKTNRGLAEISQKIQQSITALPHVGTSLPKKWVDVRRALETNERNYISLGEYTRICEANGFTQRTDQLQLSDYLHDLGVCLHFQKDPILKHTVILKPEWATTAVYKALDTKSVRNNLGRFTRPQLDNIWSDDEYSAMCDELLQLMMQFKLCYEIPGHPQHYIAPQLLSPDSPDYDWNHSTNLLLRYRYGFMPKGIFTRLVVELHEFIENQQLVWKTGAVFTNGTARAEVIEHYPKREIRIRVSGNDQKRWLSAVTHEIEKIHQSYTSTNNPGKNRLRYQTLIPCNCTTCKGSQTPHDYPYERLQKFLRNGQYQIQCQESYQMVDVRRLLDDILYFSDPLLHPERGIRPDDNLQGLPLQDVSSIRNSAQIQTYQELEPTKEVFISYAWGGDSEDVANKIDTTFQTKDITLIRDKRDLGFKGRIKAFMEQIGRGKAVIVVISDKYLKSENCMFELVEIAANGDFYDRIFPIVLTDAEIYKPIKRIRYLQHWEQEIAALNEAMKTVNAANLQGFRESIDLYTRIRSTIAELTETLKDMNTLTPQIHTESGFADLISAVEKRLNQ